MPLINQPNFNLDASNLTANPFIDWNLARDAYVQFTIENHQLTSVSNELIFKISGATSTGTSWTQIKTTDLPFGNTTSGDLLSNNLLVIGGGFIPNNLFGNPYEIALTKQWMYIPSDTNLTDPDMRFNLIESSRFYADSVLTSIESDMKGLYLLPGGYWESNTLRRAGSTVLNDEPESGKLAGFFTSIDLNDATLGGKITCHYGYTYAPYIQP
jgi:hypothetical protein